MAQIDPSIAMSIRPAQIESPLVHAARASELQGAQQSQFMNMLKMKEYGDESRTKNAMMKWLSDKPDLDDDKNLNTLATQFGAQGLALAKQIDDRRKAQSEAAYRTEQTEDLKSQRAKRGYELGESQTKNAINTISGFTNRQQALDMLYESEANGTIPREAAENIRRMMPDNEEEFPAFKQSLIERLMTADQRMQYGERQTALREKQADQAYSEYVYDAADRGETPMPKAAFLASFRQQPAPDAAPAAAPTATSTPAPAETAAVAPNGDRMLPGVERVEGFFGVHPQAAAFYRAGNKEMGDKIQAAHVEQKKREQLTGDFQNVMVAEQTIAELEKNPTPLNLRKIASLRQQINAANEGKAPKITNVLKLPPQEKAFEEEIGKGQAKDVIDSRTRAEDAREILDTAIRGREMLKMPIITGAGANFFVGLDQALKTAGMDFGGEASANAQAYGTMMASNTAKLIKNFGSGTGLSDADRKYAERMAAGDVTVDKRALEKILQLQEIMARKTIERHNKKVKGIKTNIPLEVELDGADAPSPNAPAPYSDAEKERRYQEWKAKQKGNKP